MKRNHPAGQAASLSKNLLHGVYYIILIVLILLSPLAQEGKTIHAQSAIQVQSDSTELDFPNRLTFLLDARSSSTINKITLEYGTNGRTCVRGSARQAVDFSPGEQVSASWEWDFKDSGSLPPGAEVWWQWEVSDQAGNTLKTGRQTLIIEDNRLEWRTVANEQVSIVWSEGARSFGQLLLDIATESLERLEKEAGIRPPGKVRLTIFPSFEALRAAGLFLPEWTGGVAFAEYSTTMIGLPLSAGEEWAREVIPHELAHLVTNELVFNCLGAGMTTWLSEGLATYSEGESSPKDVQDVRRALEAGSLPPLRNLAGGFSANSDEAVLSYTQSAEVIRFMISSYGADKIAALLAAIQSGKTINPALLDVYNLDTDGIDNAWRLSLGYGSVSGGQAGTPTKPAQRTAVPTLPLWTPAFGNATATPQSSSTGEATATPIPPAVAIGPTLTETPCTAAAPCTIPKDLLATPQLSATAAEPISALVGTAMPESPGKKSSPFSCLGGNALFGLALVALFIYTRLIRSNL